MSTAGQTVDESNNWMAIEDRLVSLLTGAVADIRPAVKVLTAADLEGVKETGQHTPALHLVYRGFRVLEAKNNAARLQHTWLVIAAVRNVAKQRAGAAARADAGPLLALAMGTLMGARVEGATTLLEPVTPPPAYFNAGYLYLPSAFVHETIFRKSNN